MFINLQLKTGDTIRFTEQFEVEGRSMYYNNHKCLYKTVIISLETLNREESNSYLLPCYHMDYKLQNTEFIRLQNDVRAPYIESYIDGYIHSKTQSQGTIFGCIPK